MRVFCYKPNLGAHICVHVFSLIHPQRVWLGFSLTPMPQLGLTLTLGANVSVSRTSLTSMVHELISGRFSETESDQPISRCDTLKLGPFI